MVVFIHLFVIERCNCLMCSRVHRSHDFKNFLAKCLVKDPDERSCATELLDVSVVVVFSLKKIMHKFLVCCLFSVIYQINLFHRLLMFKQMPVNDAVPRLRAWTYLYAKRGRVFNFTLQITSIGI